MVQFFVQVLDWQGPWFLNREKWCRNGAEMVQFLAASGRERTAGRRPADPALLRPIPSSVAAFYSYSIVFSGPDALGAKAERSMSLYLSMESKNRFLPSGAQIF